MRLSLRPFYAAVAIVALGLVASGCTSNNPETQKKLDEASKEAAEAGEHLNKAATQAVDAASDIAGEAVEEGKKALNKAADEVKDATDAAPPAPATTPAPPAPATTPVP